jgi:hypothetical protein
MLTKNILKAIVAEPALHARWLETLSYLENSGAKKLINYQGDKKVSSSLLQHTFEEAGHAFFFKDKIRLIQSNDKIEVDLLASAYTKRYLNIVDLFIARCLKRDVSIHKEITREANYYLCSYVVELRACALYKSYDAELRSNSMPFRLKSIISEEVSHLSQMKSWIKFNKLENVVLECIRKEEFLFSKFIQEIAKDITAYTNNNNHSVVDQMRYIV